ncbi:hypothetical protein JRQ81_017088, partial [Phrynocephalus forsythii]
TAKEPDTSRPGINELPEGDESLPLGDHLSEAMVERIISGKFVDIFELLNREIDAKELEKLDDKEKERIRKCKPDRSWNNWLNTFVIYAGIYTTAHPEKGSVLWHYLDLIIRACLEFPVAAWLMYNEGFRCHIAKDPSPPLNLLLILI